jgi:hypothetical protein
VLDFKKVKRNREELHPPAQGKNVRQKAVAPSYVYIMRSYATPSAGKRPKVYVAFGIA